LGLAERVGIRSRARSARAPTEGASPLVCSPRRGYSPANPPVRIPPSPFHLFPLAFQLSAQSSALFAVCMAARVGFEPTVPLPGRMLSKHVDSSTLAPLRTNTPDRGILARDLGTSKASTRPSIGLVISPDIDHQKTLSYTAVGQTEVSNENRNLARSNR